MKRHTQRDLLVTTLEERGPLFGLAIRLPDKCRCGHDVARLGAPVGPHAELRCMLCQCHRGWLPRVAHQFLLETVNRFSRPDTPIFIRRSGDQCAPPTPPAECASDLAASPDLETEETRDGRET
jgi:hypothetical protein